MNEITPYMAPTSAQIDILRNSVCKDLSNDQLQFFLAVCQRRGLDPFAREIYAMIRGGKLQIGVEIDGYRRKAAESGEYDGQDEAEFDCLPGEGKKNPQWARVTVYRYRDGRRTPTTARVFWQEHVQFDRDGRILQTWQKMAWLMLAKCAESQALRRGFPRQTAGMETEPDPNGPELAAAGYDHVPPQALDAGPAAPPPSEPPPALLGEWNKALAAFAPLGVDAERILKYLGIGNVVKFTDDHVGVLHAWYDELTAPRE